MSFVVALTGGIASGKITVANLFLDQFGIDLVDADVIARDVVEPETEELKRLPPILGKPSCSLMAHSIALNCVNASLPTLMKSVAKPTAASDDPPRYAPSTHPNHFTLRAVDCALLVETNCKPWPIAC